MRPAQQVIIGTGTSNPIALDRYISPFNVGLFCEMGTGTGQFTVQHTLDNYFSPPAGGLTWNNHPTLQGTGGTASAEGTYSYPVSAVRIIVGTAFPSGTGTLLVNQAGIGGA